MEQQVTKALQRAGERSECFQLHRLVPFLATASMAVLKTSVQVLK